MFVSYAIEPVGFDFVFVLVSHQSIPMLPMHGRSTCEMESLKEGSALAAVFLQQSRVNFTNDRFPKSCQKQEEAERNRKKEGRKKKKRKVGLLKSGCHQSLMINAIGSDNLMKYSNIADELHVCQRWTNDAILFITIENFYPQVSLASGCSVWRVSHLLMYTRRE